MSKGIASMKANAYGGIKNFWVTKKFKEAPLGYENCNEIIKSLQLFPCIVNDQSLISSLFNGQQEKDLHES